MRLLSSGGEECDNDLFACDDNESPINASSWKVFFEASSTSKYMRLQPFPEEGEPWRLWSMCCADEGVSITDHVLRLAKTCPSGAAALAMAVLPQIQEHMGQAATLEGYEIATQIASRLEPMGDCKWLYQTNRAAWNHFDWFLSDSGGGSMPCGPGAPKIYVDEPEEFNSLWENSLKCAERGLCFTEVWLHQFLRRAECRVERIEEADFVYVPIYMSCYDLHTATEKNQKAREALEAFMSRLQASGPPLLLVFSCEKWKIPWRKFSLLRKGARRYVAVAVETKPLVNAEDFEDPQRVGTWHCEDCFRPGHDIIIPSAIASSEAHRLLAFNRQPKDRTLLLTWRGEHAESDSRSDVRQGYLEVNETVRPKIIKAFQSKSDADVGRSSMRYSFLLGNAHFCLVPRGRGWWTVRLFEAIHAGCIPVLLSDEVELPFSDFLSWDTFSVKWPMDDVGEKLYHHLDALRNDWPKITSMHQQVRKVACWFDYQQPNNAPCSPYQGFLKQLARSGDLQPQRLLRHFWF